MQVALFITCLLDAFYPRVGQSSVRVLERLGVRVEFPTAQTCCGQPAYNSGFEDEARIAASTLLDAFRDSERVVSPSGSCVAMVRNYIPGLFADTARAEEARALANKTFELCEFLVDELGVVDVGAKLQSRATYHPSCHGSRGLGVREQPLTLLRHVDGLELVDLPYAEDCCGFGGTFAVKFGELSEDMGRTKARHAAETGADILTGIDMSCLMHIGGVLRRGEAPMKVMHVAEILDSKE